MLEQLIARYDLLGWFIVAFIANSPFPLPFEALVLLVGIGSNNVFIWSVICALGATLGEATAYLLGVGTHKYIHKLFDHYYLIESHVRLRLKMKKAKKITVDSVMTHPHAISMRRWFSRWGFWVVLIVAFLPIPMLALDIIAGYERYSLKKFFLASMIGKATKYVIVVYIGASVMHLFV